MSTEVQTTPTTTEAPPPQASDVLAAATETPVVEAAPTPPAQAEDDNFAKKFAALSRKEKELRKVEEETKSIKEQYAEFTEAKKLAKANPDEFLKKFGVTYEELTEYYINGRPKVDPRVLEVEEKLKAVQEELTAKEKKLQDEARNSAISAYKAEIKSHVKTQGDKYEFINASEAYDLVYQVTKEYFDTNDGKILTHDEAAEMVEKYLEQELEIYTKTSKLRSKFAQKADTKPETPAKIDVQNETKTLTNSMTSSATNTQSKPLTREESLERAARLIKWQ
jgi:hypothetical protein